MSGIIFFNTEKLDELKRFYINEIGCSLWMDQGDCVILQHDNFLLGFCQRETADTQGCITFFYKSKEAVDRKYKAFMRLAKSPPVMNPNYPIYNFFASDPEGRTVEFQYFTGAVSDYLSAEEVLLYRRSIRWFKNKEVPQKRLNRLLEVCRYAPTSCNFQSYYLKVVRDGKLKQFLADRRGQNSAPIGRAPLAIAIIGDTSVSKRPEQDACIAAYHLLLAAWNLGLGTCWIGAMDRDDVKEALGIPKDHYVATVTPLGFPEGHKDNIPERKSLDWFVDRH